MVCREYRISSVVIAQIRTASWLDDAQIQSVYHSALHDPTTYPAVPVRSRDDLINRVLGRARRDLDINPIYRGQRRAGLRARLEGSLETELNTIPEGRLSALWRLENAVSQSQQQLSARLSLLAARRGMSDREALTEFHQLRAQAPAGRQPRATAEEALDFGLIPADPRTRYALQQMEQLPPRRTPAPLVDQWIPVQADASAANPIVEIGISEVSDRVELRHRDGNVVVRSLTTRARTELVAEAATAPHLLARRAITIEATYPRGNEHRLAGWRSRCDDCGQFIGNAVHQCTAAPQVTANLPYTLESIEAGGTVSLPRLHDLAQVMEQSPTRRVTVPVTVTMEHAIVAGQVTVRGDAVRADEASQSLDFDEAGVGDTLRCSACDSSTCADTFMAREQVRRILSNHRPLPPAVEQETASTSFLSIVERSAPQAEAPAAAPGPAVSFVDDPSAFRAAASARASTPPAIGFHASDGVLTGYAAGVRFGVELEFGGVGTSSGIGAALHRAGLTSTARQVRYHDAGRSGHREWVLERDCTVAGELVTPILSDTSEHWGQLATACSVIRNGGGTFDGAGSHTNISADGFEFEHALRLVRLMRTYEDDLYRMGRTRGANRGGTAYARPLIDPEPVLRYESRHPGLLGATHGRMVNFDHLGRRNARIEFRFPDASHDESVIQAQVMLCAAMTNYVRHNDIPPSPVDGRRALGVARQEGWTRRLFALGDDEFAARTSHARSLIDTLFTTTADRERMARLWGQGSYHR